MNWVNTLRKWQDSSETVLAFFTLWLIYTEQSRLTLWQSWGHRKQALFMVLESHWWLLTGPVTHLLCLCFTCVIACLSMRMREQWKWGSFFQNLKERGGKKDEIRGLVTYKNPKASSLATDPTDRIILCFTAAPSQSYHYRIVVSLPQKETIRCVHFSTGMFLLLSNKHPLEDPSNKNEV